MIKLEKKISEINKRSLPITKGKCASKKTNIKCLRWQKLKPQKKYILLKTSFRSINTKNKEKGRLLPNTTKNFN